MQNHSRKLGTNGLSGVGHPATQPRTEIHDVLRTPRRWFAIEYLAAINREVDFDDILKHVCERVYESRIDDVSPTERKRIRNSLYQTHLPRLKQEEIVEYDRETGLISPGPQLSDVVAYMDGCSIHRGPLDRLIAFFRPSLD